MKRRGGGEHFDLSVRLKMISSNKIMVNTVAGMQHTLIFLPLTQVVYNKCNHFAPRRRPSDRTGTETPGRSKSAI